MLSYESQWRKAFLTTHPSKYLHAVGSYIAYGSVRVADLLGESVANAVKQ